MYYLLVYGALILQFLEHLLAEEITNVCEWLHFYLAVNGYTSTSFICSSYCSLCYLKDACLFVFLCWQSIRAQLFYLKDFIRSCRLAQK